MIADPHLDPAAVELGIFLPHPPTHGWHALTDPDRLEKWLLRPIGFTAEPGTPFQFTTPGSPHGEIRCEVLEVRRYEQLTSTWLYPSPDSSRPWIVEWTLHPQGRGTRLLLTQKGFDITDRRQRMVRNAAERSWKRLILPRLDAAVLD